MHRSLVKAIKIKSLRCIYWILDQLSNIQAINTLIKQKKLHVGTAIVMISCQTTISKQKVKHSERSTKQSETSIISKTDSANKTEPKNNKKKHEKSLIVDCYVLAIEFMPDSTTINESNSLTIDSIGNQSIYISSEEPPIFIGGEDSLRAFINNNIKYPHQAMIDSIEGRVYIRFAIMLDGSIDKIVVLKGIHPQLDSEAVRVTSLIPKWIPAKTNGQAINVWYTIPINFKIPKNQ